MLKFQTSRRRGSLFLQKMPPHIMPLRKSLPKLDSKTHIIDNGEKNNSSSKEESCNITSKCKAKVFDGQPVIDNEASRLIYLSCNKNLINEEIDISSIHSLPAPNDPGFDQIFKEKIQICNFIFNFLNPLCQFKGKTEKSNALLRINSLLSRKSLALLLSSEQQDLLLDMINRNIFDQDPFIPTEKIFRLNLQSNFVEPAWSHYSVIFKILNQFVFIFPGKCTIDLVKKTIRLMNIPDVNERENLAIFLKNYTKVHTDQFDEIWKLVKNALTSSRCGIYSPFCVDPIVSYLTIILMSNSVPNINNLISQILPTHLLPLFDHSQLSIYFPKLSNLIIQIIDNNFNEQLNVIQYLFKHFPIQCGQKQPLFFTQLSLIIQNIQYQQLNEIATKILNFIEMAIKSPNHRLAELALLLLMKPNMKPIIFSNYELAMDILYEPLKWASSFYWEKSIKNQSGIFLSTLMNAKLEFIKSKSLDNFIIDSQSLEDSSEKVVQNATKKVDVKDLAKTWASVFRVAAKKDNSIDLTRSLYNVQIEFKRDEENLKPKVENSVKRIPLSSSVRNPSFSIFHNY